MAAERLAVLTFTDGRVERVARRLIHSVKAEGLGFSLSQPQSFILAQLFFATGGKGGVDKFEAWVETLADWSFEDVEESPEGDDADPPDPASSGSPN